MFQIIKAWVLAVRPRTLPASIAPVMIGTAMAYGDGIEHLPTAGLALLAALLIQIGTNLANDYGDFIKGADRADRLGPVRVTQAGLISPEAVKWGAIIAFFLAACVGSLLIARAGVPALIITVVSILCGILYTAGPWPLAYVGLGELFVLIFFGPVAVVGTYYVQSFEWNMAVLVAGFAPGALSVGILEINNLRDIDADRQSNKRTLAVRWGRPFARRLFLLFFMIAALVPMFVHSIVGGGSNLMLSSLILILGIPVIYDVMTSEDGPVLNRSLARTGGILFIYALVFSFTWIK